MFQMLGENMLGPAAESHKVRRAGLFNKFISDLAASLFHYSTSKSSQGFFFLLQLLKYKCHH